MSTLLKYTACIAAPLILISGCGGGSDNSTSVTAQSVAIDFDAQVNGSAFTCNTSYPNIGSGNHSLTVKDFRMYISDLYVNDTTSNTNYPVTLMQDGVWQNDNVVMLDFENGCEAGTPDMNSNAMGSVSVPDTVDLSNTQLCFTAGLPFDKNHINEATASSPLNASGMLWAWRNGRKYIRIDGSVDGVTNGSNQQSFNLHLGAIGCANAANNPALPPDAECSIPNSVPICLDHFDMENDSVVIDPAPVIAMTDISIPRVAPPGCQSFANDDDCIEVMPRLGLNYDYGSGTYTSAYTGDQMLFTKSP